MPKRKVLLVDDEVTLLLTMKAVLEINGFDVDTAASAREGKSKIKLHEYQMVITDMRMESDAAGREVILAARTAAYHPAVALLTAHPESDEEFEGTAADKVLVKAMDTAVLMQQLEDLLRAHSAKLQRLSTASAAPVEGPRKAAATKVAEKRVPEKKSAAKRLATKRLPEAKKAAKTVKSSGKSAAAKRVLPKKRKK